MGRPLIQVVSIHSHLFSSLQYHSCISNAKTLYLVVPPLTQHTLNIYYEIFGYHIRSTKGKRIVLCGTGGIINERVRDNDTEKVLGA